MSHIVEGFPGFPSLAGHVYMVTDTHVHVYVCITIYTGGKLPTHLKGKYECKVNKFTLHCKVFTMIDGRADNICLVDRSAH